MKIELTIPTTLNDIKLVQYQKFLSIAKDNEEGEFLQQKMVQLFCGIDLKDVAQIRYKDVAEITANINKLFTKENAFIQRFKMGGVEFGFIPNLDDMTTGEYMDLDNYITDWDTMHNAMAVLYRPITNKLGNKYQIEEYKGSVTYADVMRHAPLDVVLGAMVFFLHFRQRLVEKYDKLFGGESGAAEYSEQAQFGKRWGWYSSIYALAQGNVRRFDEVSKLPITQSLTWLTFEKEKTEIEMKLINKKQ
jgi:hypothetical protein